VTTKLSDPVYRELEYEIEGRKVIIGMEVIGDKPVISCRLKGLRSGWHFDARRFADLASKAPRVPDGWELKINDPKLMEDYGKEICKNSGQPD
jgi:hypothetical protein